MSERRREGAKGEVTRRETIALGLGLAVAGCASEASPPPPPAVAPSEMPPAAPPETPPAPEPAPAPAPVLPSTPAELLAGIEHIVVLMMENRSFDHYLGALKKDPAYAARASVDGLAGTETNLDPDGDPVAVFKMDNFTPEDPPHSWDEVHAQWNQGANDGFVTEHAGPSQHEVMGYHDRSQLPLYYWFADNFAVCDAWFSSVLGPTWPNRYYLHATTSGGKTENHPFLSDAPPTLWERLKAKDVSAKNYTAGLAAWVQGGFPAAQLAGKGASVDGIGAFFDAARDGTLPAFTMIDPDFLSNDDHPSHNILRGQAFVASIYKALAESPLWSKTLFIVTYDEHGGFYDHVPPPETVDARPEFKRLGFRVPAFVIGPTVKKGYVCKKTLEHCSVAATLKTRWDIASLTARMDATNDVSDCIDPVKAVNPAVPPTGMPQVAMTLQAALYDGVGHDSQPMLGELVARGMVTPVDARSSTDRIQSWLRHAVRLGAIRLV